MIDLDSLTIQREPFAVAWGDSAELRSEHEAEIGGSVRDGVPLNPNIPMLERIEAAGALLVMTVRGGNGAMHGYAVSMVTPSMENAEHVQGYLTALFVDQTVRGVGPRLIRASVDALRERGCREVILRAGVRGSGPKAGALYRRMGAKPLGMVYSLMGDA